MRALSLLALLIAAAIVLWLFSGKAAKDVQTVQHWQIEQPGTVEPLALQWREAEHILARLEALTGEAAPPREELAAVAKKTAQWVAGSRPGSPEYRLAVSLRAACLALAQAGREANDPQRHKARQELAVARSVLAGQPPGGVTQGIQDQIKNLQLEQGERLQEVMDEKD